jgi:hypothetical protein
MNREIRDFNQTMLDFLKENQKRRQETEAYEEAFNKLSNEERKIINSVELKISKAKLEELEFKTIKEEEKQIKELTKKIEDNKRQNKRQNKRLNSIGKATLCVGGAIVYLALTIGK